LRSLRRQLLIVALVVAGAVTTGFYVWRRPPVRVAAAVPAAAIAVAPAPLPHDPEPAPSRSPRHYTMRTESTVEDFSFEEPKMRSIANATAEDYRRRARFPRWSQPIEDGIDPIARDHEITHDRSLGPEGRDPTLVTFPARTSFEAPNPIFLYAYLVQDEHKVDARSIRGEVRNQQGAPLAAVDFRDDGRDGDSEANDLVFTARLAPPADLVGDFKGAQLVEVHAETKAGNLRVATTGFLYSVPLAHPTGRYRDQPVDGNLQLDAEVVVDAPGRFHLEATLARTDGTPIAWSETAVALEPGTAWIPLTYYGGTLRDRNVDGPYVLRSVALSTTGEMPNQKNDVVEWAYVTQAYPVTVFSDKPFDDPDLIESAKRLERDALNGPSAPQAAGR
jgi:hypothetical protein